MALFPERLSRLGKKETATQSLDETARIIPDELADKTGIKEVETAFKANVQDAGQPLIQTPQTQQVTLQVPAVSLAELEKGKKGSTDETRTWRDALWIRAILLAIHKGRQVLFGPPKVSQPVE